VEDVPAHGRGAGTRRPLRSLPTQTILRFCEAPLLTSHPHLQQTGSWGKTGNGCSPGINSCKTGPLRGSMARGGFSQPRCGSRLRWVKGCSCRHRETASRPGHRGLPLRPPAPPPADAAHLVVPVPGLQLVLQHPAAPRARQPPQPARHRRLAARSRGCGRPRWSPGSGPHRPYSRGCKVGPGPARRRLPWRRRAGPRAPPLW